MAKSNFTGLLGVTGVRQANAIRRVANERLLSPYDENARTALAIPRSTLSYMGWYKVTIEITPIETSPTQEIWLGEGKAVGLYVKEDLPNNEGKYLLERIDKSTSTDPSYIELDFFNRTELTFEVDDIIMGYMDVYSHKMFSIPFGAGGAAVPAYVTAEISARTGTISSTPPQTAGQGTVDLLKLDPSGALIVVKPVVVYNWTIATFDTDTWVHVSRDAKGTWWIDAVDCEEAPIQTPVVS